MKKAAAFILAAAMTAGLLTGCVGEGKTPEAALALDIERDFAYCSATREQANDYFGTEYISYSDWPEGENTYAYEDGKCIINIAGDTEKLTYLIRTASEGKCHIRDIEFGDTVESVLEKFPREQNYSFDGLFGNTVTVLYGKAEMGNDYGCIELLDGTMTVSYYDGMDGIHFVFDGDGRVSSLVYENDRPRSDCLALSSLKTENPTPDASEYFAYPRLTAATAQEVFGKPTEVETEVYDADKISYRYYYCTYESCYCEFTAVNSDAPEDAILTYMSTQSPGVRVLGDLRVGDPVQKLLDMLCGENAGEPANGSGVGATMLYGEYGTGDYAYAAWESQRI